MLFISAFMVGHVIYSTIYIYIIIKREVISYLFLLSDSYNGRRYI